MIFLKILSKRRVLRCFLERTRSVHGSVHLATTEDSEEKTKSIFREFLFVFPLSPLWFAFLHFFFRLSTTVLAASSSASPSEASKDGPPDMLGDRKSVV